MLDTLTVDLLHPHDRPEWERLMRQHHYLGFNKCAGRFLLYTASLNGRWVALLSWASAAFKCKARDEWIGWLPRVQWKRLRFLVNNTRFLILPDIRIPNLASRILSLNRKRLVADWFHVYDEPLLLAETFVDPARFFGTCYKADNWMCLGQTRGFARRSGRYTEKHGLPKLIFIKPLIRNAAALLSDPCTPLEGQRQGAIMDMTHLSVKEAESLFDFMGQINDVRTRKCRHHRKTIMAIGTAAVLSGARTFAAITEWGQNCSQRVLASLMCYKDPKTGNRLAPCESTIQRFFNAIDPARLDEMVSQWVQYQQNKKSKKTKPIELPRTPLVAVAIDGKTIKGAKYADGSGALHLFSALLHREGVVFAQEEVDQKSNEIPAVPKLLAGLDLQGKVVTADALHTQTGAGRYFVEQKNADYFFTAKGNQPTLKNDIASLFTEDFPPGARANR
ncbi:MAG: hypothetical protein ACD_34C00281G0002 [uncultured bacterium]|nr:MAG: hypothetical protein ACD_34C00281G0002 [uncultured bacterium]